MAVRIKHDYFAADLTEEWDSLSGVEFLNAAIKQAQAKHPSWDNNCTWRLIWTDKPIVKIRRERRS